MRAKVVFLVLCVIWGSTWIFIKEGLADLPPFTFAGIRFVIAASILWVYVALTKKALPRTRSDWGLIAVVGLLVFSINYGTVFWGEQHVSSGLASVLQTMIPVFGLVIAHAHVPGERLTPAKIVGVVLGVLGVGVVVSDQFAAEGVMAAWGGLAIVGGAFAAAYANVIVKMRGNHIDPAVTAAGQMSFGLVPLLGAGFLFEGSPLRLHWSGLAVVCLLYLAVVGSSIAFVLYYWLVRNMDVTNTMLIALVTPLVAVAIGMAVRHEALSWRALAGGACILGGIGLITARRRAAEPSRQPAAPSAIISRPAEAVSSLCVGFAESSSTDGPREA